MAAITVHETEQALKKHFSAKFAAPVHAEYDRGRRAFNYYGSGLPAHPDMAARYPNGWSMSDYISRQDANLIARGERENHLKDMTVFITDDGDDIVYATIETASSDHRQMLKEGVEPKQSLKEDAAALRAQAEQCLKLADRLELAALKL